MQICILKSLSRIFSKNSVRNELHSPFLPFFDTQHLICKFSYFVRRGSQWSQNNFFYIFLYLILFQLRFVKIFFWLTQKKYFVLFCNLNWYLILKNFHFVGKGVPDLKKKKNYDIYKEFQLGFVIRFFN